jgi:hypothetical protein
MKDVFIVWYATNPHPAPDDRRFWAVYASEDVANQVAAAQNKQGTGRKYWVTRTNLVSE